MDRDLDSSDDHKIIIARSIFDVENVPESRTIRQRLTVFSRFKTALSEMSYEKIRDEKNGYVSAWHTVE